MYPLRLKLDKRPSFPHPTGGGGVGFRKILDKNKMLRKELRDRAEEALSATEQKAVWLGSGKQAA